MDLSSLREHVSNLSLYDVKAGVRKLQNGKFVSWSWRTLWWLTFLG